MGPVRTATNYSRQLLDANWRLCAVPPGRFEEPAQLSDASVEWIAAEAPSTAAACLRAAGLWSLDNEARRFDGEDWWYALSFEHARPEPDEAVVLGFDGLATVADVWLNGELLLRSDNMFRSHEGPANLVVGRNELFIRFRALDPLLAARRGRPKWRTPMIENQQLRWFRTTLLGRTPGWSPPAAVVGPWRDMWIERRKHFSVAQCELHTELDELVGGRVHARCRLPVHSDARIVKVELRVARGSAQYSVTLGATEEANLYHACLELPNVDRWWPCTHGEPALYSANLDVHLAGKATPERLDLGKIGFRSVAVDTADGDFRVRINDVSVFCRGACWTPLDPVSLRASPEDVRAAIAQVRAAGMNMLRVPGMITYESDEFLDRCDEEGVLLWQDFMFANMSYPEDDAEFIASVTAEARQQLARIAHRPCLTVLCGNSEGEQQAAMWGAPRTLWATPLFHEKLPALAQEYCPNVPYWPSSAHGGAFPHQGNVGTTSYYGVGAYLRPIEDARRSDVRFASECLAFANVPSERALARIPGTGVPRVHLPSWKARTPRDLGAGWDFDDVRDHYLERVFKVDARQLRYADHERYLALSRAVSGEVMAGAFAEWRRQHSVCRGALIWFLRDLWCGAGWGVIDALGAPKAAYHYLRRALQPVSLAITDEGGNGLFLHLANERPTPLAATVELKLYRNTQTLMSTVQTDIELPPHTSRELPAAELLPGFEDLSYAYRFGPRQYDLIVASLRIADGSTIAEAFHFDLARVAAQPVALDVTATAHTRKDGNVAVALESRSFAQTVWFESEGYLADEEYFHLPPGSRKSLLMRPLQPAQAPPFRGRLHALNAATAVRIEVAA